MAGAGRMGYASVSARENGSSLCDDAFCAYCGRRVGGGQAGERVNGRPGDRATEQAGMLAGRRCPGGGADERAPGWRGHTRGHMGAFHPHSGSNAAR